MSDQHPTPPAAAAITREQAREVIAAAEAIGFVREPSLPDAYETYLLQDAAEAAGYLREHGHPATVEPGGSDQPTHEPEPADRPTTRERRARRADRLREWASSREGKAQAAEEKLRSILDLIPLGQPILVGHHSERRARRDQRKLTSAAEAASEHTRKAEDFRSRAANIDAAAERAVYTDDPDASERLQARIDDLEERRREAKARNAEYRRQHRDELKALTPFRRDQALPHPSFELRNLGARINRDRKRLAALTPNPERA